MTLSLNTSLSTDIGLSGGFVYRQRRISLSEGEGIFTRRKEGCELIIDRKLHNFTVGLFVDFIVIDSFKTIFLVEFLVICGAKK